MDDPQLAQSVNRPTKTEDAFGKDYSLIVFIGTSTKALHLERHIQLLIL